MNQNIYHIGAVVRLLATFTNSAGSNVDPSTVTFQHRLSAFDPASYTTLVYGVNSVVRAAQGIYYTDLAVNSHGQWNIRANGLGDNAGAFEGAFQVRVRSVG